MWPDTKKQFEADFAQGVFTLKEMLFGKGQKQVAILLKLAINFSNAMDRFVHKQDEKTSKQVKELSKKIDSIINKISKVAGTKFFIKETKE
jgi:hypothetical protein